MMKETFTILQFFPVFHSTHCINKIFNISGKILLITLWGRLTYITGNLKWCNWCNITNKCNVKSVILVKLFNEIEEVRLQPILCSNAASIYSAFAFMCFINMLKIICEFPFFYQFKFVKEFNFLYWFFKCIIFCFSLKILFFFWIRLYFYGEYPNFQF